MDATSARSLDTPSTAWAESPRAGQPFRNYEPNPPSWARLPPSTTFGYLAVPGHDTRANATSATWTSSSGDLADLSDADDVQVRDEFVHEYNRVARKHGIPTLASDERSPALPGESPLQQRRSWFSRTFLRQASTTSDASSIKSEKKVKNKRSVSDLALHLMNGARRDNLKDEDLQSLVRLCGRSKLYLPSEYSPGSLVLPTCFRATAQYLVQHGAETRGVFRIPGSVRIVNALYNHYCADGDVDEISSTICSPNLPTHVKAGTHDVASTFKRLLSGLPGGILGSLSLFDALVSIQSQLDGEAEFLKTKQTKIRARLIALAIGTVTSQLRRDLICAVFGLLCLIGRAAETTPREDEHGRPLPTSDLMGYSALGIVFGPLLLGDLLNSYEIKAANATPSGPALFPATPPNTRKERRRSRTSEDAAHSPALAVDKIYMANSITEMLITHWREVVRHMRSLGALKGGREGLQRRNGLRPSVTEAFTLRMPRSSSSPFNPGESPVPPSPTPESGRGVHGGNPQPSLILPRRRPRGMRPLSSGLAGVKASLLSPPVEEPSPAEVEKSRAFGDVDRLASRYATSTEDSHSAAQGRYSSPRTPNRESAGSKNLGGSVRPATAPESPATPVTLTRWRRNAERQIRTVSRGANPFKRRAYKDNMAASDSTSRSRKQTRSHRTSTERASQDTPRSVALRGPFEDTACQDDGYKTDVFERGRSRLSAWRLRRRSLASADAGSPMSRSLPGDGLEDPRKLLVRQGNTESNRSSTDERGGHSVEGSGGFRENHAGRTKAQIGLPTMFNGQDFDRGSPLYPDSVRSSLASAYLDQPLPLQALPGNVAAQKPDKTDTRGFQDGAGSKIATNKDPEAARLLPQGPRPDPARPTLGTVARSTPVKSTGSGVRAMAAMFESPSKDTTGHTCPGEKAAKPSGILSPYTVNPSPEKPPSKDPRPRDSAPSGRSTWLSTIRDRRPRGSGPTVLGEAVAGNNGSSHGHGRIRETARGKRASSKPSTATPPENEDPARLQPPDQRDAPKQPGTPASIPSASETRGSLPAREIPPQGTQQTLHGTQHTPTTTALNKPPKYEYPTTPSPNPYPYPHFHHQSTNAPPNPPHAPSTLQDEAEASPASTTRRFPLVPTPEQQQQRQRRRASHTTTPARDSPRPVATNGNNDTLAAPSPDPNGRKLVGADQDGHHGDLGRELARLRERLGRVERECVVWRERAEMAEERVRVLEGGVEGGGGVLGGVERGVERGGVGADADADIEVDTRGLVGDGVNGEGDGEGDGEGGGHGMAYV